MRARQKVSRAGVELIKSFEGLRSSAARLPDGRWTLGYGHTFSAREGARVTQEDADALLRFDLLPIVDALNNMVLVPLNQNQFDALVSFCFNIGVDNFGQSTVLKRINEGRMTEAALAMDAWRSAEFNGQTYVLAPLIRRRAAEKNLFLTPEESAGNAPTLLVRPVEDAPGQAAMRPSELDSPDRGGILSAYPVGTAEPVRPEPFRPEPFRPEQPLVAPNPEPSLASYYSPYAQPAPATFAAPAPAPVPDTLALAPRAIPVEPVIERVVESLPDGLMASSAMRETPIVEAVPNTFSTPFVTDDVEVEPQMSPAVQAALARAQEEQRMRDEAAARAAEETRIIERHRQEVARLEQERAERERLERERLVAAEAERLRLEEFERVRSASEQARLEQERQDRERAAADEARLELERLTAAEAERQRQVAEQARLEQERQAAEAERQRQAAEQARLEYERQEQERLERERQAAEQARLEQARLEQARLEQARLEQARLEQARLEQARLEQARLEQARLEQETAERERLAEAERAQAAAARQPSDEEAEKIRKAEAAAALMRLYSPYGGGALGKPLSTPLVRPAAPPPVVPSVEAFTTQSIIAPQSAQSSPIDISSQAEPMRPMAQSEPEDDDDDDSSSLVVPTTPGLAASAQPAPVITAFSAPYIRAVPKPEPKAEPELIEVPRPAAVDLSAPTAAAIFERPPERQKVEANWRDQLQRPLPEGYTASEATQPEQASLIQNSRASRYEQMYDDDNEAWTMDGDRIALSSEEMHEESASWGKMIISTLWWIFISGMGLACLGVATAAWWKANKDMAVVRNGFAADYTTLSIVMAAVGIFFVSVSVWLIMKRLGGLKD